MNDSPQQIIEQVLAGELDRFREIVRLFEADVFRMAAPVVGGRAAAEDITQEVFIVAYRQLDRFDLTQPFRPWLMGIARNILGNEIRRRSRETARLEHYSAYVDAMASERGIEHSTAVGAALSKCRQRLARTAADAIRARYDEGLELEQLAARLKRSVTATRQLLYRTRITLRNCIESELAAAGEKR